MGPNYNFRKIEGGKLVVEREFYKIEKGEVSKSRGRRKEERRKKKEKRRREERKLGWSYNIFIILFQENPHQGKGFDSPSHIVRFCMIYFGFRGKIDS